MQLSVDCSDRVVCEHIATALDPSSLHRRRNILLRSGGLFVVTLAKWKGGSGMAVITRAPHQKISSESNLLRPEILLPMGCVKFGK